ncbi:transcription elongation factor A N-terminal and central domain-containing protein 2-like [Penaeus chinensis]|uniref:transcription elongation factor A N-terminal and central domain-containing protein 2-like n=1 Tax=Penaeus chinensis TaxID=139456 RepID=UPI001FB7463A|nr:transcription elongation factor A N-terminal and central domain-containing protein 2-like [Penaeus chinensis]XP_047501166.1 transcription elongation factor A N-terminal and central domain-containing protein 2-like [Penaeus chinensis]
MDKFVVRMPKSSPSSSPRKGGIRNYKQSTIESLKGVVIIEDLERAKIVLERSDTKEELKIDTLKHLRKKMPAKEILVKTGLGKTVYKLSKSKDEAIAAEAKKVYKLWKDHLHSKVGRPVIEVKCDLKTQNFRNSARQMILDGLKREDGAEGQSSDEAKEQEKRKEKKDTKHKSKRKKSEDEDEDKDAKDKKECDSIEVLAEYIEREVYQSTKRLINKPYKRTIRKLVFTLRHQKDVRLSVVSSSLSVKDFVKQNLQEQMNF